MYMSYGMTYAWYDVTRNIAIRKANRCYASHLTMHMSYHKTYTWKRRNSFKGSMICDFFCLTRCHTSHL